jgi:hypothetical protein
MLVPGRAAEALERGKEDLRAAAEQTLAALDVYLDAFDRVGKLSSDELTALLGGVQWPGARPTHELTKQGVILNFQMPAGRRWETVQDARAWALETLRGVPTVAVDGSQIPPSKDFGVPVSLVQVAWFENYHDPDLPYVKDVRDEVLVPDELEREDGEFLSAEMQYSRHRFRLEMEVASERVKSLDPQSNPVVLIDGSFVLSFAARMQEKARESYFDAIFSLLETAETCRVPVVGYVDLSFASDLVTMLRHAYDLPPAVLFDAQLLGKRMAWFDRTAAFECARGDVLPLYRDYDSLRAPELCFVYVKAGQERLPSRIDVPRWVIEAGLLDGVIDTIRAEIVVGSGYPYALETVDAAAVLGNEDRMAFYSIYHKFARASGLRTSIPMKTVSKAHRR